MVLGRLPKWFDVEWFKEPREFVNVSKDDERAQWYRGGSLNMAYNVIDRSVKTDLGSKKAFTWADEDGSVRRYTYLEFKDEDDRAASFLREIGVKRGEVISVYAPMTPESIALMLASIKVGAITSSIFSESASPAVAKRVVLTSSRTLFALDGYYRKGNIVNLKANADEAVRIVESKVTDSSQEG